MRLLKPVGSYGPGNTRDTSTVDSLPLMYGQEFEEALRDVEFDELSTMVFHEPESCSFCDAVRAEVVRRIDGADDDLSGGSGERHRPVGFHSPSR